MARRVTLFGAAAFGAIMTATIAAAPLAAQSKSVKAVAVAATWSADKPGSAPGASTATVIAPAAGDSR